MIILSEILISNFKTYKDYLLYYVILNGLYFGITVSKLILSTMSGSSILIPSKEGSFYLVSVLCGLYFSEYEALIAVIQGIFIVFYYFIFYGKLIKQLLKELKIETF